MPNIGGVFVPDNLMPRLEVPEAPRPGLGAIFGGAAQATMGQLRYGIPYQVERIAGTVSPEDEKYYTQKLAETSAAAAQTAPAGVSDLTSGKVGFGRFVAENLASMVPYMGGAIAGGVVGGLAGGPGGALAGAVVAGTPQFSASNVSRAVEEQGTLTQDAAIRSAAVAPLQSAADAAIGMFLPGVGKIGAGLASKGILSRTAASVLEAGATEAVTEAGQQLGERYAAGLPVTSADAAHEYVDAAVTAFALGGVLGVGGGLRRGPAVAKPAADVTTDDLMSNVELILTGASRAPLALPAPSDISVGTDGVARVNPTGGVQLALPSPEQFAGPDIVVDSNGRAASPTEIDPVALANLPADPDPGADLAQIGTQVSPELEEMLRQAVPTPAPTNDTSVAALTGTPVGTPSEVTPPAPRIFKDDATSAIVEAISDKRTPAHVKAEAQVEMQTRWDEAAGLQPTEDFVSRLADVKQGLRGSWVTKLDAASPDELVEKVHTRLFDDADTASSVQKLGQRLGLLDENLEPTARANEIEARKTAELQSDVQAQPLGGGGSAGPATSSPVMRANSETSATITPPTPDVSTISGDPSAILGDLPQPEVVAPPAPAPVQVAPPAPPTDNPFTKQWAEIKSKAGIERVRSEELKAIKAMGDPTSLEDAQAKVLEALSNEEAFTAREGGNPLEKIAKTMGLLTNDEAMDFTPAALEVWSRVEKQKLATTDGLAETVKAAERQGYTGAQASIFDRGVQSVVSGQTAPSFDNFADMAAFEAGKVWASSRTTPPPVPTAQQSQAIRERKSGKAVIRAELTPAQTQQQSLNNLLDAADLRGVRDEDVATLRRLVRQGADPQTVGQALADVQGGKTLFRQPERAPFEAPAQTPVRGQPRFKEMNTAERGPAKVEQRVESEAAVQAFELRNLIEFARAEKGITDARAAKLHDMLDTGQVAQVKRLLKDFDPDAKPRTQANPKLPTPPETVFDRGKTGLGSVDLAFEQAITGKDTMGVLDHMISAAPSKFHREIMKRIKALAQQMTKAGIAIEARVVKPGDIVPVSLNNPAVRAFTSTKRNPAGAVVYLKSTEMGGDSGMNYQLAAHELLHAVTIQTLDWGLLKANANTQLGKDARDMLALGNAIIGHFNTRVAEGNLDDFEKAYYERRNNALADADEIIAWGLTNPDMQRYLQSIEYKPKQSVFSKLVDLLRGLLGLEGRYDTALTELLRVSERLLKPNQRELLSSWGMNNTSGLDTTTLDAPAIAGEFTTRTAQAANDATQKLVAALGPMTDKINPKDMGVKLRRTGLGWLSHNQIDRRYGELVPGTVAHSNAHRERVAILSRIQHMGAEVYQKFEALRQAKPNQAEWVNQLMDMSTRLQLDPSKTFESHEHLNDADPADKAKLRAAHKEIVKLANDMKRGDGAAWAIFSEFRALNEAQNFARMAVGLYSHVATDRELTLGTGGWANPADDFMRIKELVAPADVRDWWLQRLNQQVAATVAFIDDRKGQVASGTADDQRAMKQHLSPVEERLGAIIEAKNAMDKAPYFHLGRFGDYFGSATIKVGEDGKVDPAAQRVVADAVEKAGFVDAQISADNTKPKIALRFETADQAEQFAKLMLDLQKRGMIQEGIQRGARDSAANLGTAEQLPGFLQSVLNNLDSDPMFAEEAGMTAADKAALDRRKEEFKQFLRDEWIASQPDNAVSKVLTKRYTVAGYNKDMVRSWMHRWQVGATGIANAASAPKFNAAFTDMKDAVEQSRVADRRDAAGNLIEPTDPFMAQDIMNELKVRDARVPINETADTFDKLRAVSHSFFLGFSPAYALINTSQLGVTALPELAKKHGYIKSAAAMRRAGGQSIKILKAVAAEGKRLGWKHWGDIAITEQVLKNAGLGEQDRAFINHMIATGTIDIGSMARSMAQIADAKGLGGGLDTYLKLSSGLGLYTETFTRLITAMAARDLHGGYGEAAQRYAARTVSESMFDYQTWNSARQLGKKGVLGPVTPIVTQFMSYSVQITEKLYSEFRDAIGTDPAKRKEAQRFLLGHLTAVTALAGTMGLPFATVFAAVIEKMVDAGDDDDEPYDATAAYRNFLASVLGKDVGEVVARGLPRALGFDISNRTGEQDLLPFSQILADRRSWKEAIANSTGRSIGAAPSMVMSVLDGGGKIADGDLLGGMKEMMPVAFKSGVEAYRMTTDGYVDTKGNKLPMTPGASAVMWQLLGFSPAEKAEYGEARADQAARRGEIGRQAGLLRQGIKTAVLGGDADRARELVSEAIQFDQDNPGFAVLPSIASSIQREAKNQAMSRATGAPIGVSMKDIAGQRMTGYANF